MASDPAFSFYTNDFDSKTKFFSHEQVGMYLRLLMAQHQHGHLTEQQMIYICGRYDKDVWCKFSLDKHGNFFNERLEYEVNKRRAYSESRKKNRKSVKTKNISQTYENHMSQHMENEKDIDNDNDLKNKKESEIDFTKPDVEGDVIVFPIDTQPMRTLWAAWKEARWKNFGVKYGIYGEQSALKQLEGMNFHQARDTIQQAIASNWKNLYPEKSKSNGTHKTTREQQNAANAEYLANYYGNKFSGK